MRMSLLLLMGLGYYTGVYQGFRTAINCSGQITPHFVHCQTERGPHTGR